MYIGNFEQGIFSGYGSYYDINGYLVYCGEWKDGTYHGVGSFYENNKIWYWGEWFLGEIKGSGILYDHNGYVEYEGYMPPPYYTFPTAPPQETVIEVGF